MTDTALHDTLSLITQVVAGARRADVATSWQIGPANLGPAMPSVSGIRRASRLTMALFVLLLGLVVWLAFRVGTTHAAAPPASSSAEVWHVETMFRQAIQLRAVRCGGCLTNQMQ
jgi:hypothetical protein